MAKIMKSYRLEQYTLNRLHWLCEKLDLNETSMIELLITDAYMKAYYDLTDEYHHGKLQDLH